MGNPKIEYEKIDGIYRPIGYKVVTLEMKSLGLRNNPTILTYPIGEWLCLDKEDWERNNLDEGGIWLAPTFAKGKGYRKYMKDHHNQEVRIFKSLIEEILFVNETRIKTSGIKMFEELFD